MSSRDEVTLPAIRPKSRKSIAHIPSPNTIDKENMTADIGALGIAQKKAVLREQPSKKSRSKSIGPGGLDALKDTTGNRRKSIAAPIPKSILKPTIPPLQEIPAHASAQKTSLIDTQDELGGDTITVKTPSSATRSANYSATGHPSLFSLEPNAAGMETRVVLRTEEQQQAAARERIGKENLDSEKDLTARREARRKSLANRRVSFAPEATLHTWDVVEYLQDSTTSSASTNSTRRASSMSNGSIGSPRPQTPSHLGSDIPEPPSTTPGQLEDTAVASPAYQHNLHQKKRRRSSTVPPLNFNNPDDEDFPSSPSTGSSGAEDDLTNQGFAGEDADGNSESNSDSENEGTAMSLDVGNTTDMSIASVKSDASSTGSSTRLEEALQLAARQAGTQGLDFDDHENNASEQEEEIVASFAPWSKKGGVKIFSPSQDQENLNPFSPAFKAGLQAHGRDEENQDMTMDMTQGVGRIMPAQQSDEELTMDMTMDMTQAVGRIMPAQQSDEELTMDMTVAVGSIMQSLPEPSTGNRRKSYSGRRQSTRRRSSAELSSIGDETMDLTMAIGGIQQGQERDETRSDFMDEENMTMEFTSVIGGVLPSGKAAPMTVRRRLSAVRSESIKGKKRQSDAAPDDETMDMTKAVGGIMSTTPKSNDSVQTISVDMDMDITAVGGVLSKQLGTGRRSLTRNMPQEVVKAEVMSSPFQNVMPPESKGPAATVASETGSPSLAAFRGKGLRRSGVPRTSTTPKSIKKTSAIEIGTPNQKLLTPSKQRTPKSELPAPTIKQTPQKDTTMRTTSPRQKLGADLVTESSTPKTSTLKKSLAPNKLFQKDHTTGAAIPSIVLTPQRRRSSGICIDRTGLGSPRVAAVLDRRVSIGEQAVAFTVGDVARGVRFDDPQEIEQELDRERQEEKNREDGRKIMEREADSGDSERDATINLKEMIQSLTPKKRPLNGRKSLHVGAAKGILGKRPAELDEQDNDDDEGGVKRLKNHQGSPVKNVKLQAPPSKAETTGRLTRSARRSLQETNANIITPTTTSSPLKPSITTPKSQGRFREPESSAQEVIPFVEKSPIENPVVDEEEYGDERIQLQDFLNMTSIRFMELTTTKRRHTVAPNNMQDGFPGSRHENDKADGSLESCVVAGACTVPMLELFQHSCRELKKYISEGRSIVREIETETFEENPPLFREYMSATPDVRVLMDNQFKNVKTHTRLLSKAMWYEWRMKLLDGLKDGLIKISEGMEADAEALQHQQDLLDSTLPRLVEKYEKVAEEESDLQTIAEELASCDQEELSDTRQKLVSVGADVEAKRRMIQDLRAQIQEKETRIIEVTENKRACLSDIEEAEKVREACRGWTATEGLAHKAKVDALENEYGWAITGMSGRNISMTYRRDIELVFDASSFKPNSADGTPLQPLNSRIDLWYVAGNRELNPSPLTTEKDFFLLNIREHCRCLSQATTTVKGLLDSVSASWTKASEIVSNIRSLNRTCPTEISKTSDSSILVRSTLLLPPLATKVELQFSLHAQSTATGLEVKLVPQCRVVYGERFNEPKMTEFLENRTSGNGADVKSWADIVAELEEKLLARGRK